MKKPFLAGGRTRAEVAALRPVHRPAASWHIRTRRDSATFLTLAVLLGLFWSFIKWLFL